jgi:hypothetical protein
MKMELKYKKNVIQKYLEIQIYLENTMSRYPQSRETIPLKKNDNEPLTFYNYRLLFCSLTATYRLCSPADAPPPPFD